ncbi:MAG: selenium cofactor biosynthesis protein YqeC [Chloroflexota bacterium]|nr:selenium cofactor biosynthesis protein YqeC [Chloroflexota bacterium]
MDSLTATLGLLPGDLVALVGAGDMTGVVRRLVTELRALGRRVVSTATVPMRPLTGVPDHPFLIEADPALRLARLPALLAAAGHVRVAAETLRADKIRGVDPTAIAPLRALPGLDHLLVEADGARHRALKAPAAHEPALPPDPTVVLICADLAALGAPLDALHVHRPELVQALTGLPAGAPLTGAAVATVLTHPAGGLQGIPATARTWVVLTGLDRHTAWPAGELAAAILLTAPHLQGVILLPSGAASAVTYAPFVVVRA